MSTNAEISVVHKDQTVSTVSLHWDGDSALSILQANYKTLEQAEELVALGSLSVLAANPGTLCPDSHTFATPVDGIVIAYTRDRGDDLRIDKDENVAECLRNAGTAYHYMFELGKWKRVTMQDLIELSDD